MYQAMECHSQNAVTPWWEKSAVLVIYTGSLTVSRIKTEGKENSAWALLLANCTITKGLARSPAGFYETVPALLRAFLFLSEAVGEQTCLHPAAGQELPAGPERRRRCR